MKTFYMLMCMAFALGILFNPAFGQSNEDEARKYLIRGITAVEMATSEAGLANAAKEFEKATQIAPNMATAWYNLGSVQARMGKFREAIESYRKYLALAPRAEDAQKIRDEIVKLEYRMEQTEKLNSYSGTWSEADGQPFQLSIAGNRITLESADYQISKAEFYSDYHESKLANRPRLKRNIKLKYVFGLQGERVTGTWHREKFKDYVCEIPAEGGELEGELRDSDGMLVLRYTVTKYTDSIQQYLIGTDFCRSVNANEKIAVEKRFGKK